MPPRPTIYDAQALSRSPMHFGAAGRRPRAPAPRATRRRRRCSEIIDKRASAAGPKEVGDAWATVGVLAERQGRRDEAEDRLKRALALDPDNAGARVALGRVQCELKHCADAVEPLKKLVAAQPNNLQARIGLMRALVETNDVPTAAATLAPAVKQAPKSATVLYWQGRVLVAQAKPDREAALAKLKDAIAADPKFLPAYVAESSVFAALGQPRRRRGGAQQAAQAQAADDPELD